MIKIITSQSPAVIQLHGTHCQSRSYPSNCGFRSQSMVCNRVHNNKEPRKQIWGRLNTQ